MTLSKIIKLSILLGLISLGLLFYFYINQKNFTKDHKEFIIISTALQWEQSDLSKNILQSSLKAYFNQDIIAKNANSLNEIFKKLENADILKDAKYNAIKTNLFIIKEQIDVEIENIEHYAMLNAGIKNSMLFLTRYIKNENFTTYENQKLYLEALLILQRIHDTKNTLDLDNLSGFNLNINSNKTFIKSFNSHTNFLERKLPKYINITNNIAKNDISKNISNMNNMFSKLALNDFEAFDRFALIVLIAFSTSFILLSTLFYKYINEQKILIRTKKSLEHALLHDELTGLKNRKHFEIQIAKVSKPFVLLINIIGFKNINDIYGNDAGDILLKEFAIFLKNNLKADSQGKLYRLGSDEFAIICSDLDKKDALFLASHLDQQISKYTFDIHSTQINIQVNIAVNNIKPYLENADLALKLLKKDYSKSILLFQKNFEIKKDITQALKIIDTIKTAIEENRVIPYFQPIVNLKTMKIEKYEALIRIRCKDGLILQPYQFLELSQKSSYYNKLTKLMIEKTLDTAREYPQYRFSINISMQDINNEELLEDIFDEFDEDPITTSRLDIELLESEDMYDKEKIISFINKLNSYGIHISIDDFGTGYSNFSYFSDFNVDYLKIDGSITKEITNSSKKLHIFKSICDFSNGMNIDTIAEFVETKEILNIIQELGVKYGQGYYFSKPLPKPLESDKIDLT